MRFKYFNYYKDIMLKKIHALLTSVILKKKDKNKNYEKTKLLKEYTILVGNKNNDYEVL